MTLNKWHVFDEDGTSGSVFVGYIFVLSDQESGENILRKYTKWELNLFKYKAEWISSSAVNKRHCDLKVSRS